MAEEFTKSFIDFKDVAIVEGTEENGVGAGAKQFLERGFHGPFALGNVTGNLSKAVENACIIIERGDGDVGPESRPVLSNTPPFVFAAALLGGDLQLVVRFSSLDVFRRIENGEVPSANFLKVVSLDPLGALGPGHDAAFRIEKEDGIVLDVLHQ